MHPGIGKTLREARSKRELDLSEVEEATKIRMRFLRAIESEEWDLLPGGVYTRSFIRTYASYLGLDGQRLADEYEGGERPSVERPVQAVGGASQARSWRLPSGRAGATLLSLALIAVIVAIGLSSGGGGNAGDAPSSPQAKDQGAALASQGRHAQRPPQAGVSVRLLTTGEVWICLLDASEKPLVNGQVLAAGSEEGPFRSGRFTVSFGNGKVSMQVDGSQADIPISASPLGYEVNSEGELKPLPEAERPTCT